ncbi:MAG: hypothetical protein NTX35_21820 [Verrucomicrobia bacterium]|nr:hypothetical protein [Verrucomicrobiota bacterium]
MKHPSLSSLMLSLFLAVLMQSGLQAQIVDTDNDRMADSYETTHGLIIGSDDRYGDIDGDGYPNLAEYLKGTSASSAANVPAADRIVGAGQNYTTIGAAITSLTADDQIIVVRPGTYVEALSSTVRRVFIISEVLDPNATLIKPASGNVVNSTKDLYLRGFTLAGVGSYGVNLTGGGYYGIVQCILRGHSYGIYSQPSSSTVRNFVDVIATLIQDGTISGIYSASKASTFRLVHATICGHRMSNTTSQGVAIYNTANNSAYTLTNCVLWNGGTSQIFSSGSGMTTAATYSCIKGSSVYTGTGNINSDPLLVQGYLNSTSPCINTGTSAAIVPFVPEDLRGDTRTSGSAPDMGAHEYSTVGSWAWDLDVDGVNDAAELYTYGTLFYSSDTDGDRVNDGYEVAQGLNPLVDDRYGDKDGDGFPNLAEYLKGSAAGTLSSVPAADRTVGPTQTYTTISAAVTSLTTDDQIIIVKPGTYAETVTSSMKRVFLIAENGDPNATIIKPQYNYSINTTKDMYVRGFTLATPAGGYGAYFSGSGYYGIVQCILRGHQYGIYSYPSSSSLRNYVDVIDTLIQDGSSYGIYSHYASSTFRLVHTTICGHSSNAINSNTTYGTGSTYALTNCVMWNPAATAQFLLTGSTLTATYSCIKATTVYTGTGNINSDPLLAQGYLTSTSPCIDTGTATTVPVVSKDLRGDARTTGSAPDMGAHEYSTVGSWAGDVDGDGLTDTAEVYTHNTFIYSVDTDADRVNDGYEVAQGLNPLVDDRYGDKDGDGYPNLAEFLKSSAAGTASSVPTADRIVGPSLTYTTISAAVTSLTADDQIIVVKASTYAETVTSTARRVFIIAESMDPNATTIKPQYNYSVTTTKDLYLRGFTLVTPSNGYGVYLSGCGYYGIVQCVMRGHQYGIYSYPSSSSLRNYVDVIDTIIQDGTTYGIYSHYASSTFRIVNTTICGHGSNAINSNTTYGTGSTYALTNCVMWNPAASAQFSLTGSTLTASYSCIKGATVYTGTGNINTDPLLVQGYLRSGSPCIDAGTTAALIPSVPEDVRGDARTTGSAPDMGAHEYSTGGSWASDFDGDGLTDTVELYTYGSFFYSSDTDTDRVSDGYEIAQGLNVFVDDRYADTDGDGFPNLVEHLKSTSAGSAGSVPTADRTVGAGQTYTTISDAINSLSADDQLIVVKPGTYAEALKNTTRRVFIIAENMDPNATTIRPSAGHTVSSTKDLYLRGFTLASLASSYGVNLTGSGYYGIVQCVLRGHMYGIYTYPSSSTVRNNIDVIDALIQDGSAGVFMHFNSNTMRLVHTTFSGHTSSALYNNSGSQTISLTNCILWSGSSSQIYNTTPTAAYSCIKGGSVYTGAGNINSDPLLVQGYLSSTSPCIGTAIATTVPVVSKDLRGDARTSGSAPDMGAHEYSTAGSWAGDFDGDSLSDTAELYTYGSFFYSNDTDADRINDGYEITEGLNVLVDDRYGDADGDGFPNLAEHLKSTSASSASSVPMADRTVGPGQTYSTISGAITSLSTDDQIIVVKPGIYAETLNNNSKRVFIIAESIDPNATTIKPASGNTVSSTKDMYLRGFTLASLSSAYGVNLTGSGYYGVVQCILRGHSAGIYSQSASSFARNYVDVMDTLIQDGVSYGIYASSSASTFRLVHATISGHGGNAIYSSTGAGTTYTLTNCVMWNPSASAQFYLYNSTVTAMYSCIKGTSVYTGTGNINSDPLLAQGYLGSTSPCINVATTTTVPVVIKDLRGDPRTSGSAPDMGAHEYSTGGTWAGDFDGDGLSDVAELYTHGSQLYSVDTDTDRMSDGYEVTHGLALLVDDRYADTDNDGFPNLIEFVKSTQASSATSVPTADRVVGAGQTYTTISAALTSLTADDMLIVVKPGVYNELVNNAQSNDALNRRFFLIAESLDPATTFIRAAPGTAGAVRSRKDLYLAGFTVDGVMQDGISFTSGGNHGIAHCILRAHRYGVGVAASPSTLVTSFDLINCLVTTGDLYGIQASTPTRQRLVHTTITGHGMGVTSSPGRSINLTNGNHILAVSNSILWSGGSSQVTGATTITYNNSCVRGTSAPSGTGNTNGDPLLNQGRLIAGSAAVNIGGSTPFSVGKDLALNGRVFNSVADAGCYEFQKVVPSGTLSAHYLTGIDLSAGTGDFDGDGLTDANELVSGTDPFIADTDGDGVNDSTDRYPLDPSASGTAGGSDTTPPFISISQPSGAVKL